MSLQSVGLFAISGSALLAFFYYEKKKLEKERESKSKEEMFGKPRVGGPFALVRDDGIPITNLDFKGKFTLMYFGYTVRNHLLIQSFVLMFALKN
jgi:protein SCO1/2